MYAPRLPAVLGAGRPEHLRLRPEGRPPPPGSPGLSMRFTDEADHRALVAKARQLREVGVVSFALFFDDVPLKPAHPEDRARWPDAVVAWTGSDVVAGTISRSDIDRAAATYQRRLVLWDNVPVNDFEPSRLFLGPLTGRTTDLAEAAGA